MNQDVMNQIKIYLNEFPDFFKNLLKNPTEYIDREVSFDWVKITLYGYLVTALTQTAFSLAILNIGGLADSIIFYPIQTLIVIGFISFLVWFVLDRAGFSHSILSIFKLLVFAQMLMGLAAVPIMVVLLYIKSLDLLYIAQALIVAGKAYLVYRGFNKQFQLSEKRAFAIVGIFTIFLLAPIISNFSDGYSMRKQVRNTKKLQDMQMEQSIDQLEKELGSDK
jgi:hypothetical protein